MIDILKLVFEGFFYGFYIYLLILWLRGKL